MRCGPLSVVVLAASLGGAAFAEDAAPAQSPACRLLTPTEAQQVLGHAADVQDGAPESGGISSCSWVETETYNALGVLVNEGDALGGVKAADAYDAAKAGQSTMGPSEDVLEAGDKAFLVTTGSGPNASLFIGMLKGERIVNLNGSGLTKDRMIAAARLVAGHL